VKRYLSVCASMKRRAADLSPTLLLAISLAGCASPPTRPIVVALPGHGQSLQEFQANETSCRNYAQYRIETAASAPNSTVVPVVNSSNVPLVGYTDQQRYDVAYAQCMVSRGATINTNILPPYPYIYPYPSYPYWPGLIVY
jgi:hypothetical protein